MRALSATRAAAIIAAVAAWLPAGQAHADPLVVQPLVDARLRYELVDQAGLTRDAEALTLRVRPAVLARTGAWSALVEGEAVVGFVGRYNDGTNGRTPYPLVADPENVELNRAQISYSGSKGLALTAGRQRIELLDQRFVGSSGFRQSEQTFDAVRVRWGTPNGLSVDISYAWSDRTINGVNGRGARQQAVSGNNVFALAGYGTALGTLTGFAYLVDQDEAAVQSYRLSSQTYGVRLAGGVPLGSGARLAYAASWARQSDWHRNPNRYSADYWLAEGVVTSHSLAVSAGYEILGADNGLPLTSVQTPLASLFKWQGWADRFTTTPPNGLRDLYAGAAYGLKAARATAISLSGTWHRFDSDRAIQHYGDEVDLLASAKRGRHTVSARYARYRADAFATDTDKFWLSLEWSL